MEYKVKIEAFEGPLDLLLHLINQLEIDIYDIPMAEITEQYLIYIHAMKKLELDVASEYLVMAATLLAIKSKMLLPNHEEEIEHDEYYEEQDPRDELVEQLMEYKKYKEVAISLQEKEYERSEIFMKTPSDLSEYAKLNAKEITQSNLTIFDMLGAYHKMLRRKKLQRPLSTKITHREVSIEERMEELLTDLQNNTRKNFFECFDGESKQQMVVTFLAMLELMKRHEIIVEQERNFSDIYLKIEG